MNNYKVGKPTMARIAKEHAEAMSMFLDSDVKKAFKVVVDSNGFARLPDGSSVSADKLDFDV